MDKSRHHRSVTVSPPAFDDKFAFFFLSLRMFQPAEVVSVVLTSARSERQSWARPLVALSLIQSPGLPSPSSGLVSAPSGRIHDLFFLIHECICTAWPPEGGPIQKVTNYNACSSKERLAVGRTDHQTTRPIHLCTYHEWWRVEFTKASNSNKQIETVRESRKKEK